jgi:hypothetical protein
LNYTRTVGASIMPPVLSPGASLVLGASVARNDPQDHFVRLCRTAPNPLNYTRTVGASIMPPVLSPGFAGPLRTH